MIRSLHYDAILARGGYPSKNIIYYLINTALSFYYSDMPRLSIDVQQYVKELQPEFAAELQRLPSGPQPGARDHRETRVRLACEIAARRERRISAPLIRAVVNSGSPNDVAEDIRRWTRDIVARRSRLDLPEGYQDFAKSVEELTADLIRRATEIAEAGLQPAQQALARARAELEDERRSYTTIAVEARSAAASLQERVTALESQVSVERSMRGAAEAARVAVLAELGIAMEQRNASSDRASRAEADAAASRAQVQALERRLQQSEDRIVASASATRVAEEQRDAALAGATAVREELDAVRGSLATRDAELHLAREQQETQRAAQTEAENAARLAQQKLAALNTAIVVATHDLGSAEKQLHEQLARSAEDRREIQSLREAMRRLAPTRAARAGGVTKVRALRGRLARTKKED